MISLLSDKPGDFYSSKITAVKVPAPEWKLRGGALFFMGSCFADNLYVQWQAAGLKGQTSPFGNIYNPASLAEAAGLLAAGGGIEDRDCFQRGGDYFHFMFHSLIRGSEPAAFASMLNKQISDSRDFILNAEAVVITLGTAYAYRRRAHNDIVNNCHRLPSSDFERFLISTSDAAEALQQTARALLSINPRLRIILTLSPVRHLRDDATGNSLSKAVLRCAIDEAGRNSPGSLWYFPSYEILLDELRDYRWFASDLCHPSDEAVSYIISRFINAAHCDEFKGFLADWLPIVRDMKHRPLNPESEEHGKFKMKVEEKLRAVMRRHPEIAKAVLEEQPGE